MKYACSEEGVEQLNTTTEKLAEGEETIRHETDVMKALVDDYRYVIGPHANELEEALNNIGEQVDKSANVVKDVEDKLKDVARRYQEIIDNNPFGF